MTKLFLTGYEKKNLDDLLRQLDKLKIKALIDVRETPLSRKNGFSKPSLEKSLMQKNIHYYHFPELGSPRETREKLYSTGDYLTFFTEYRDYIKKQNSSLKYVTELILTEGSSALLCYEKNYELCHRSIIVDEIMEIDSQIMVTPI